MKKIISGKKYDTETAECVAVWTNGLYPSDFAFTREKLYRKRTGELFLYCYGGGNSVYGVWHGNTGGPGEDIKPVSDAEARKWAEKKLDGDEYESIFGECPE